MDVEAFRNAMDGEVAERTLELRLNALKRIERKEDVDLDDEFDRDGLSSILARFTYTADDERSNQPNPTKMDISSQHLRKRLGWLKSHLNQYRKYRLGGTAEEVFDDTEANETSDDITSAPSTFGLEADLQAALRETITQLEPGLKIIDGGMEKKVPSGFIDILAEDHDGTIVVIELKAGTAKDAVIAQILGYMGDISQETSRAVRGIIIAADFRPRVESAARAIPNLTLKSYSFSFEFK